MTPANAERQRRSYDAKRLVYCCDLDGARAFSESHFNLGRYICRIGRDSRWCRRGKFSWNSRDDGLDQFSRAARQRRADVSRRRRNRSPFAKSESARQRIDRYSFFRRAVRDRLAICAVRPRLAPRSEEHTSELQSQFHLVCRLLLEKKKKL